jgi:hypothetical protein
MFFIEGDDGFRVAFFLGSKKVCIVNRRCGNHANKMVPSGVLHTRGSGRAGGRLMRIFVTHVLHAFCSGCVLCYMCFVIHVYLDGQKG